jgi:hypothetical protein
MASKSSRKKRGGSGGRGRASAPSPAASSPGTAGFSRLVVHALLLLLVGGVTYAGSISGPFIFDDIPSIVESTAVRALPNLRAAMDAVPESPFASRPVPSLSFAANYAVHGLEVTGYHLVNIATHLACGLVILGVVRRTLGLARGTPAAANANVALVAALIWVVHPLNSEVVNYLTQRTESLMALFLLLTIYAGIRALDGPHRTMWQGLAVAACALGMASKETMVTAPLLVVLYDRVFVFDSFRDAFRTRGRLYLGLIATLGVLAASMLSSPRTSSTGFANANTSVWDYLLNQTVLITRYLRLTLWPDDLVLYYGFLRTTTLSAVWPYAIFRPGVRRRVVLHHAGSGLESGADRIGGRRRAADVPPGARADRSGRGGRRQASGTREGLAAGLTVALPAQGRPDRRRGSADGRPQCANHGANGRLCVVTDDGRNRLRRVADAGRSRDAGRRIDEHRSVGGGAPLSPGRGREPDERPARVRHGVVQRGPAHGGHRAIGALSPTRTGLAVGAARTQDARPRFRA